MEIIPLFRKWVGNGGVSNHFPLFLGLVGKSWKRKRSLEFKASWIKEEEFIQMVRDTRRDVEIHEWGYAVRCFEENMNTIKQKKWNG